MIRYAIRKYRERRDQPTNQDASPEQNNEAYYPPSTSQPPKQSKWEEWKPRLILMSAIILPVFLETLDYTVVATSQTNIASIFNRLDLQSYIGTAYVLGSTVFLPISASIADVWGRYWAMQAFVFFFLIGSAICTGASSMPVLLVGRGISGIGAAGLLAIVRILLADSASLDDNNAQAALMILAYTVGYSLGPVVGGLLLRTSWRWVFGINLPVCIASMILMHIILPKRSKGPQPPQRLKRLPPQIADSIQSQVGTGFWSGVQRIDIVGSLLFVALGILILLGLNWGSTEGWNQVKVIVPLAVGGFLIIIFVIWEYIVDHSTDHLVQESGGRYNSDDDEMEAQKQTKRAGNPGTRARAARFAPEFVRVTDPMLPMNMFRSFDVVATDFASMTSGMVMLGIFYFVAIFYVIVSGKDAVSAGVQLLYFAPGLGLGVMIAMRLIKIIRQPRPVILFASAILPIGVGLLSKALYENNQPQSIGFLIMTGAGVGLGFGPLSYQARFSQPEDRVAIVVASNLFFRTAGGTIGLAQLYAVMYSRVRSYIYNQVYAGHITPQDAMTISASLNNVGSSHGGGSGGGILDLPEALRNVATNAFRDGLRWAFISLIPWLVVSFVLCLFLSRIPDERLNQKPVGTQTQSSELQPIHEMEQAQPSKNHA
ncbi:related to putative multidrug transporter [Serendipita indica DSM 11827]|uniref:Related to putative multidrug transporter n=1 Tax=Serendipita indica (strain DSM 11827) TaxID=1109443 RepID=G4TX21_SERID|nr:related to putative multidrug transporter [Serendipita indica DSM 11827]